MMDFNYKATPTDDTNLQLPCSCRTCLINYMGSMSHIIMLLVNNNNKGGRHTQCTNTHTYLHTNFPDKEILRNYVHVSWHAHGLIPDRCL